MGFSDRLRTECPLPCEESLPGSDTTGTVPPPPPTPLPGLLPTPSFRGILSVRFASKPGSVEMSGVFWVVRAAGERSNLPTSDGHEPETLTISPSL